jgi:formate hydrogenlyase subunit 3/multisubunit Na+/H+ antiporter MnhD subunit
MFIQAFSSTLSGSLLAAAAWCAIAVLSLIPAKNAFFARNIAFPLGTLAGLVLAAAGLQAIWLAAPEQMTLPLGLPDLPFHLRLDPLAGYFLMLLGAVSAGVSVYAMGYFRDETAGRLALIALEYHLFLASMAFVILADDAYLFMVAWETMALSSYFLVTTDHKLPAIRSAGFLYLLIAHLGAIAILLCFGVMNGGHGDYTFDALRTAHLQPRWATVAFLLAFFGFGAKAGMIPLHAWLPEAHPAAPSPVSALMSGIMLKTAIYGMIRVIYDLIGDVRWEWGMLVLVIGAGTTLFGVLYALMQHDLKRLLAYHSVENIGIILLGFGMSMVFVGFGHPAAGALGLIAALYHTLNHAVFKALLFLGAGAVLHATHTRNMEEMGGLAKRMRWTAIFFLVGAVAISALPPLNGFISEWLTYQSLLQGFGTTTSLVRIVFPISGAMLALTGALAAMCFVKAFGITFLAQPRSDHARHAHEASFTMLLGQGILAAACVFLGLFPTVFLKLFDPLTQQFTGQQLSAQLNAANGLVLSSTAAQGGTVSMLGLALLGLSLLAAPLVLWLLFATRAKIRRGPTWDCGQRGLTPQMEYTATGFSKPIRMIFKALFRPHREVQREYDFSPYFTTTLRFESHVEEVFQTRIYRPLNRLVLGVSRRLRALQAGSIQAYLIYIFITLLLLLLFAL